MVLVTRFPKARQMINLMRVFFPVDAPRVAQAARLTECLLREYGASIVAGTKEEMNLHADSHAVLREELRDTLYSFETLPGGPETVPRMLSAFDALCGSLDMVLERLGASCVLASNPR